MTVEPPDLAESETSPPSSDDGAACWVALMALIGTATLISSITLRTLVVVVPSAVSPELADIGVWLSAVALTSIAVVVFVTPAARGMARRTSGSVFPGLIALAVIAIGIAWTEFVADIPVEIQGGWWLGFGSNVALATFVLIPVVLLVSRPASTVLVRYLAYVGVILAVVWYLPTLINPPWSFDAHHSNPVLNDVLGPYAGRLPFADQVPQYTSLLGIPLAPLLTVSESLTDGRLAILLASAYLSALAIATVALLVWVTSRILPSRVAALATLLLLPVMLVSGGNTGSIGQSFSALPARLFLPAVVVALMVLWWADLSRRRAMLLGAVSGLGIVNNPEFGLVAALALLAAMVLGVRRYKLQVLLTTSLGVLLGITAFLLCILVLAGNVHLEYFAAYARAFGQGSLALAMPSAGTFIFVLALPAASLAYASIWLRAPRQPKDSLPGSVAVYAGVITLGTFAYYVGRSSSSGQLQALLPFFALSLMATVGMTGLPVVHRSTKNAQLIVQVVVASLLAFALASVLQAPSPRSQWGKVVPDSATGFLLPGQEAGSGLPELGDYLHSRFPGKDLALALDNGNLLSTPEGMKNISPLSYVTDASLGEPLSALLCDSLVAFDGLIIVGASTVGMVRQACPTLHEVLFEDGKFSVLTSG